VIEVPVDSGGDDTLTSERAVELLNGALDFIERNGVAQFSLAAIAEHLGTSSRMLIYHLGTRDQILGRALTERRIRTRELLIEPPPTDFADAVTRIFRHYTEHRWEMELFFFVSTRAFEEPDAYSEFSRTAAEVWLSMLAEAGERGGLNPDAALRAATIGLALVRGLLLDLSLSGAIERVCESFDEYISSVAGSP